MDDLPPTAALLRALDNPRPIRLRRVVGGERWSGFPTQHAPTDSILGLAIWSRNKVVANLYLAHRHGEEFTDEDEELLIAFATTAGVAIEDARLHEQAAGGQRWQQASAEITEMLLAPNSGSDPLQVIVEKVCQLAAADLCTLVLPSENSEEFEIAVASGSAAAALRGKTYPAKNSMVRLAVETGRGIRVAAVHHQHRFEVHLSAVAEIGPVMAVPLSGHHGSQGALMVGRRIGQRAFTRADLELAEAFARHASIARDLANARADQRRLVLLKERARIARDLHDHVIQRLFAAGLTLQSVAAKQANTELTERLDTVVGSLNDTIRQIRTSIFQLHNSDAGLSGVRSIVVEILDQITPALGFMPMTRFSGPLDTVVAAAELDATAAVVREAVTNVAKHAQATELDVGLSVDSNRLSVTVTDNGIGLKSGDNGRLSGLDNLKRRAEIFGGTITLTDNQPHGTQLIWTIPLL